MFVRRCLHFDVDGEKMELCCRRWRWFRLVKYTYAWSDVETIQEIISKGYAGYGGGAVATYKKRVLLIEFTDGERYSVDVSFEEGDVALSKEMDKFLRSHSAYQTIKKKDWTDVNGVLLIAILLIIVYFANKFGV